MNLPPYARDLWQAADLQKMVEDKQNEDQHLDFKAIASLLNEKERTEMSRDVSSMANADGGTIIYGISEAQGIASRIEGAPAGMVDRDTLFRVLNSRIQPSVAGLRISEVALTGEHMGTYAYVLDIPRATTLAPHQAHDKVYYRRYGVEKLKLDHSGVVDLFRRADAPQLQVRLVQRALADIPDSSFLSRTDLTVAAGTLLVENLSPTPCMYALFDIMIDSRLTFWGVPEEWDHHGVAISDNFAFQNHELKVGYNTFQRKWNGNAPDMVPIFQGSTFCLAAQTCAIGFNPDITWVPHFISWRCRAPGMREIKGHIAIWLDNTSLHVENFEWE